MSTMKICYLADANSVITEKWVNYFAGKGHEIHVITKLIETDWVGEGYAHGIRLHPLAKILPRQLPKEGYVNILPEFIHIRRLINLIRPDILHAHAISAYAYMAAASGFHPLVMSVWGSDVLLEPKSRFNRFLTRYALKRADLITCNGEHLMAEATKLGADCNNIKLIYHGVDTAKFSPGRSKAILEKLGLTESPVVISIRKLRPVYHIEMLIRSIPLVLEQIPQVNFVIASDGEQMGDLQRLAASLNVSDAVRFIGWVPPDMLSAYLASSDIYVSTSLSDGTSISLQEAMACELPPVVTDIPANREWIKDGDNGYLVAIDDIRTMAERITGLIANRELREEFGRKSRQTVMDRAELEREMSKMEKLYEGLLAGKKAGQPLR